MRKPKLPRPKESEVQARVKAVLAAFGYFISEFSQGYRLRRCPRCNASLGRNASTRQTVGIPDLHAHTERYGGDRFWVEVKRPGEKPTAEQLEWHERERAAGGTVFVVDSGIVMEGLLKARVKGLRAMRRQESDAA